MAAAFFGFPHEPVELVDNIRAGIKEFEKRHGSDRLIPWTGLDYGHPDIIEEIRKRIIEADYCLFDVTKHNANVAYEIGLATGLGKPINLFLNTSIVNAFREQSNLGIFDTRRLKQYKNGHDLALLMTQPDDPYFQSAFDGQVRTEAPVFFQNLLAKNEFATRYLSSIKSARLHFRQHDPEEDSRLPLSRAYNDVVQSAGLFLSLLSKNVEDSDVHNMRAYLLAGLADGLGIPYLVLKYGDFVAPLDLRDRVTPIRYVDDVDEAVDLFAPAVIDALQEYRARNSGISRTHLNQISLGASAAENEFRRLDSYFVETREYFRALRGEAQLIVGRKGTGKTAIFWQMRDRLRADRSKVILDLRPEGYQLRKFSETLATSFSEATHEHTMTAFWEYVLLLEIAYKILEQDSYLIGRDPSLAQAYEKLSLAYHGGSEFHDGDFSERLLRLLSRLRQDIALKVEPLEKKKILTTPEITAIVFRDDIHKIRGEVFDYLQRKSSAVILVDNLDKGWTSAGVSHQDTRLLLSLIDASRKIQRDALKRGIDIGTTIFLRDDVYEFVVRVASDRGKDTVVRLSWNDVASVETLVNNRIGASGRELGIGENLSWSDIAVENVIDDRSIAYVAKHAMFRPRAVIDIIEMALSYAAQSNHDRLEEDDLIRAVDSYSVELLQNLNFEIRDVFPQADRLVYGFSNQDVWLDRSTVEKIITSRVGLDANLDRVTDILLWMGFLGVVAANGSEIYIFDTGENIDLLKAQTGFGPNAIFSLHPTFRVALRADLSLLA